MAAQAGITQTLSRIIPVVLHNNYERNGLVVAGDAFYQSLTIRELPNKINVWINENHESVIHCSAQDQKQILAGLKFYKRALVRAHATIGLDNNSGIPRFDMKVALKQIKK